MKKKSERSNVLAESGGEGGKNFVHAVINAVTKGYADNTVVEDIIELVQSNEISKGVLLSAPEALRSYADNFSASLENIAEEIEGFEIEEAKPTIRRRQKEEGVVEEETEEEPEEEIEEVEEEEVEEPKEEKAFEFQEDPKLPEEEPVELQQADLPEYDEEFQVQVLEDWGKYSHNTADNKVSGVLLLKFDKDMAKYRQGAKVVLKDASTNRVRQAIFSYLKSEYPNLKAKLDNNIFKGNLSFKDLKKGRAQIEYEIKGAY